MKAATIDLVASALKKSGANLIVADPLSKTLRTELEMRSSGMRSALEAAEAALKKWQEAKARLTQTSGRE